MKNKKLKNCMLVIAILVVYILGTSMFKSYLPDFMLIKPFVTRHISSKIIQEVNNESYVDSDDLESNAACVMDRISKVIHEVKNPPEWGSYYISPSYFEYEEIIPFDWDYLYVSDWSLKSEDFLTNIQKDIRVKTDILETGSEGERELIIVKDHKIVAYTKYKSDDCGFSLPTGIFFKDEHDHIGIYKYDSDEYRLERLNVSKTKHIRSLDYTVSDNLKEDIEGDTYDASYECKKFNSAFNKDEHYFNLLNVQVYEKGEKSVQDILNKYKLNENSTSVTVQGYPAYYYYIYSDANKDDEYSYNKIEEGYLIITDHCYYDIFINIEEENYKQYHQELITMIDTINIDENYYK